MASTNISPRRNVNDNIGYSKNKRRRLEMYVTSALVELDLGVEFLLSMATLKAKPSLRSVLTKSNSLIFRKKRAIKFMMHWKRLQMHWRALLHGRTIIRSKSVWNSVNSGLS